MILTGTRIKQAREAGELAIEPFDPLNLNPNSYNYHLGDSLLQADVAPDGSRVLSPVWQVDGSFLLRPRTLYLAATREIIGSNRYVVTLLGRSSLGRLGLFLNVTADLGHAGSFSQWTLELTVVQPLRVYAGMTIGQVAFWVQCGPHVFYRGRYHRDVGPVPNRDPRLTSDPVAPSGRGS